MVQTMREIAVNSSGWTEVAAGSSSVSISTKTTSAFWVHVGSAKPVGSPDKVPSERGDADTRVDLAGLDADTKVFVMSEAANSVVTVRKAATPLVNVFLAGTGGTLSSNAAGAAPDKVTLVGFGGVQPRTGAQTAAGFNVDFRPQAGDGAAASVQVNHDAIDFSAAKPFQVGDRVYAWAEIVVNEDVDRMDGPWLELAIAGVAPVTYVGYNKAGAATGFVTPEMERIFLRTPSHEIAGKDVSLTMALECQVAADTDPGVADFTPDRWGLALDTGTLPGDINPDTWLDVDGTYSLSVEGDSISNQTFTGETVFNSIGFPAALMSLSRGRFSLVGNEGFTASGGTLADMVTDRADLADAKGDVIAIMAGTNDINGGASAATLSGYFDTLSDYIVNTLGKPLLWVTCLPRTEDDGSALSAAKLTALKDFNTYLRGREDYAAGIFIADPYDAMVLEGTDDPDPACFKEEIGPGKYLHPSPLGAYIAANAIWQKLAGLGFTRLDHPDPV